ncbi:hypothetical protein DTO002I6_9657 [Penicillium roqueforti]|nr:hypothetical protein DTO002I6_9657 [Penicillium roqueforti]
MPVSIFDSSASNLSTQSAMEAYTHAMQAHTLSQISFLDPSEYREISDRVSDDVSTNTVLSQGHGPPNAVKTEGSAASFERCRI